MESITISRLEVHNDEETKVLKDDNSVHKSIEFDLHK